MTILLHGQVLLTEALAGTAELSSRPERSVVEGPAVSLPVLTQTREGWDIDSTTLFRLVFVVEIQAEFGSGVGPGHFHWYFGPGAVFVKEGVNYLQTQALPS